MISKDIMLEKENKDYQTEFTELSFR